MNTCQSGHKEHDTILVETKIGPMMVYNWEKYKDVPNYCTGKDDISRTLINGEVWEKPDTEIAERVLKVGNKSNLVWDFGSHIGWYSIMAAKLGYRVFAIDGDAENLERLKTNAELNNVADKIDTALLWVDENTEKSIPGDATVELCKIDIEGNEVNAINMIDDWIKAGRVKNILMEVSPIFNESYMPLVERLKQAGYKPFRDGNPFDNEWNFTQANFLFKLQK